MFLGTYEPRLDEKGRLILPAKYRDELSGGLVLTRGQDRCVYVFPMREFEQLHDRLRTTPVTDGNSRNHLRMFLSAATDDVPDRQGRVTIPAALRQWASLERDVAVIGAGARVEIWDARAWHDYVAAQEDSYSAVAEEVIPGIF